jgi:hypothetical protein
LIKTIKKDNLILKVMLLKRNLLKDGIVQGQGGNHSRKYRI